MDDETPKPLWALRKVNEVLIKELKTAIFALEKVDEFSPEKR